MGVHGTTRNEVASREIDCDLEKMRRAQMVGLFVAGGRRGHVGQNDIRLVATERFQQGEALGDLEQYLVEAPAALKQQVKEKKGTQEEEQDLAERPLVQTGLLWAMGQRARDSGTPPRTPTF